jgi:hypothetical protein
MLNASAKIMRALGCWMAALGLGVTACSTAGTTRGPASEPFPVEVWGGDEASFAPAVSGPVVKDPKSYDVVIVGGGLAGLSAAVYLTDRGKTVLLLEKEKELGGLAAGVTLNGLRFDRGAAYWTDTYPEEQAILKHIGLGSFKKRFPIPEPIDSYLWKGRLYPGVWDAKTLAELPASFALFRHELKAADKQGLIPNQPFEEFESDGGHMDLDGMTTRQWIESMPAAISARADAESKAIAARYRAELSKGLKGMEDVVQFMDLYCRSALGTNTERVSAMAFANFYISEIETRYTTEFGTGQASANMKALLLKRPHQATILTQAAVGTIQQDKDGIRSVYVHEGRTIESRSRYLVFSTQLGLAPKLIQGFAEAAPEQAALMKGLVYSNYAVHNVFVQGHPYRVSYDTWSRPENYTENDFTDFILARWMDPVIHGYEGMRDFKSSPPDGDGLITIYHPLPPASLYGKDKGFTRDDAIALANRSVGRLVEVAGPVMQQSWGTRFEVKKVITNRWPFSVHVAEPGHFTTKARILRKPFGNIFFANNNMGTPAFEEALFRGHCAADNVLARMDPKFQRESWSRCPISAEP